MTDNIFPRARRNDLLVQEVLDEIIVYDTRSEQVHCLNSTAAAIWLACDGNVSIERIAAQIGERFGSICDANVVYRALERLDKCNLLETSVTAPPEILPSRRVMIKKAGAAAVLLAPLVTTIVAPMPAMAISPCAPGPQGPQGPQGPCGPQGPQGRKGFGFRN